MSKYSMIDIDVWDYQDIGCKFHYRNHQKTMDISKGLGVK